MNEIKVEVRFKTQELIVEADKQLITGDYATSKLVFTFDDDYSAYRLVFGLKNPKGEVVLIKDIEDDNEIVLVAYNEEGKECSLFGEAGRYIFEVSRYDATSRLTSAYGCIYVEKEQVRLDDEVFTPYIPLIDQLFDEVDSLKEEIEDITGDDGSCVKKADVLSIVDGSNYEETEKPVNTQAVINYVADEVGNAVSYAELNRMIVDGEISANNIYYKKSHNPDEPDVTIAEQLDTLEADMGDVSAVLDELHRYAQALIGGES